ncbi:MAG: LAGLIDADG family homing endonuclease [Candidatus Aenigmatarchaeota archaeon]
MIGLKDIQGRGVYLKLREQYKNRLLKEFESNFDISILKHLGYKTVWPQWRAFKREGAFLQLSVIKEMCEKLEASCLNFSLKNAERNVVAIKSGSRGRCVLMPKLPLELNESISSLIAHVLGDGDIHPSGSIRYTNSDANLISSFVEDLGAIGSDIRKGYDSNAFRIYAPKIVKIILSELGLKDRACRFVLEAPIGCQSALIQALFDDEGSVNLSSPRIMISSSNRDLLETITLSLKNSFQIVSRIYFSRYYNDRKGNRKSMWNIDITGYKNFEKFSSLISSQHAEKVIKLRELLSLYTGKKIRTLRHETKDRILGLLSKGDLTKQDIARKLGLSEEAVSYQIRNLIAERRIFRIRRVGRSGQKAILWSLSNTDAKLVENNSYNEFSKTLLNELNEPKDAVHLSRKFNRCVDDILYFLRRMEKDGIVKRSVNWRRPHSWSRVF